MRLVLSKKMAPLTNPKHEAFCLAYIARQGDMASAFASVYPGCKTPGAIRIGINRIRKRDDVSKRIAELRGKVAAIVTEQTGIDEARIVAEVAKVAFAVVEPTARSKMDALKLLMDRFRPAVIEDHSVTNIAFIDAPPRETREQWEDRVRREFGPTRALEAPTGQKPKRAEPAD